MPIIRCNWSALKPFLLDAINCAARTHFDNGTCDRSITVPIVILNGLRPIDDYIRLAGKKVGEFLFVGRRGRGQCVTTRQYARLVSEWMSSIGLDPLLFGTHSLRCTKATLIYRRTGNLRAVQILLGHTKIESTVRYLGIEVDDALAIA